MGFSKPEWRRHLRQLLQLRMQNKSADAVAIDSEKINANLREYLKSESGVWAAFSAIQHEPILDSKTLSLPHIQWVFPVVQSENLRWFAAGPRGFQEGAFGILEPVLDGATEFSIAELSGVLIPGLGFDQNGRRLGWGKGFYDRALKGADQKLIKVGIAWSEQVVTELPREDHDHQVDVIITEKEVGVIKWK